MDKRQKPVAYCASCGKRTFDIQLSNKRCVQQANDERIAALPIGYADVASGPWSHSVTSAPAACRMTTGYDPMTSDDAHVTLCAPVGIAARR